VNPYQPPYVAPVPFGERLATALTFMFLGACLVDQVLCIFFEPVVLFRGSNLTVQVGDWSHLVPW
jgi:hypothetical protein